jgi:serine/threonine protein phosphatase PrpC
MTTEHNSDNAAEVKRILDEHPKEEERDIIRGDRLLGILAPLRAFGDFKFKWMEETINQVHFYNETPIKAFDFRKQSKAIGSIRNRQKCESFLYGVF